MLACSLAVAAGADGFQSVIFDIDPLSTASVWANVRENRPPSVIRARRKDLSGKLVFAKACGVRLAIIDTASQMAYAAIHAAYLANFALIPCRPGLLDIVETGRTVRTAWDAGTPVAVVLNAAGIRSPFVGRIRKTLAKNDVELAPVVYQRVHHGYAIAKGKTALELDATSKAANEIDALWRWLRSMLERHRKLDLIETAGDSSIRR